MDNKANTNVRNPHDFTNTQLIQTKSKIEITKDISDKQPLALLTYSSNKKNRVKFNTNNVSIIHVESFKKYNSNVYEKIEELTNTKSWIWRWLCKCKIF
jgi:hypothetical protein